jgi:serpin B
VLRALGVRRAVTPLAADFTGISPLGRQLYINRVRHRVFVDVNEEGTEAAAATLVGVGLVCACVTDVRIDAPFLWAIRERHSGTILFLGTMTTPPAP